MREFQLLLEADSFSAGLQAPASHVHLLRFIARLYLRGLSTASIGSKLSAIAYWYQLHNWGNPADNYIVKKVLTGVANHAPPLTPLKGPVMPSLLKAILEAINRSSLGVFDKSLFRAVFLTALFLFLCVSEYTQSKHNLRVNSITLLGQGAKLNFSSFKFSCNRTAEILLPSINSSLCPVKALRAYILRPSQVAFFFVDQSGGPLKVSRVRQVLRAVTAQLNIPKGSITPHSFRIGVATTTAAVGLSDDCIMRMGRWSSAAFC